MLRPLPFVAVIFAAALLAACGGGGDETPSPTATATATATGATPTAAPVARVTRTPAPATPTALPATATPAPPTPVALPALPEDLAQYAPVIARYLTATGAPIACPDALLDAWAIPISPAARCAAADTDADGQPELVLVLTPPPGPPADPGLSLERPVTVAALHRSAGSWAVAFQSPDSAEGGGFLVSVPGGNLDDILMAVRDVNNVPGAEVVYRVESCGAHTCFTTVEVYGWSGSTYADLTDGDITISYADVALEDTNGNGDLEIIMHGGAIGSVGAGPSRTRTEVYGWNGRQYALAQVTNDPSQWLYHNVVDADDAFAAGDLSRALELYALALADRSLSEWKENERAEMDPYLHFRMAITYMALGGATTEAAQALDAAVDSSPGSLHGEMARAFRDAWLPAGDTSAGCRAANDYVRANLETFQEFWDFGYGNREFDAERMCPF